MTREQISANINDGKYRAKYPDNIPNIMGPCTIIDGEKTVNWNREKVEQNNQTRKTMLEKYYQEDNAAQAQFATDCCVYIQSEISVSDKQAHILFNYAYEHGHACGFFDVLSYVDDTISLVRDFMEAAHDN